LCTGIHTLVDSATRGYGDHSTLTRPNEEDVLIEPFPCSFPTFEPIMFHLPTFPTLVRAPALFLYRHALGIRIPAAQHVCGALLNSRRQMAIANHITCMKRSSHKRFSLLSCMSRRNAQLDASRTNSVIWAGLSFDSSVTRAVNLRRSCTMVQAGLLYRGGTVGDETQTQVGRTLERHRAKVAGSKEPCNRSGIVKQPSAEQIGKERARLTVECLLVAVWT
jgi:hypothetical protein